MDEEGYSIRPENAASISQFPDQPSSSKNGSDTDSDFDDDDGMCMCTCMCGVCVCVCTCLSVLIIFSCPETETRIKSIKIKETAGHPQATVDDIKASVMSLRLGAVSPGIKKATSTHSLNGNFNIMTC